MQYPFTASPNSVAIFFSGKMRNIPKSDPNFMELYEHLKSADHDFAVIERLVDIPTVITRLTVGEVTVVGNTVHYKGMPIRSSLAERLLDMVDAGFDASNWARFMSRVMENPSETARDSLFTFLDKWKAPITEDGHFIAFKRVRKDYRDIYTGTMDNSPGQLVEMDRAKVNPNRNETCSYGLHVAATNYLASYASADRNRTIACKVDPADVVAVPADYNHAKMRVCKYLVLSDAEESFYMNAEEVEVYDTRELLKEADTDLSGRRICADPVTFSQDWKRDMDMAVEIGTFVAPAVHAEAADLPENRFMVGVVVDIALIIGEDGREEGTLVDVQWQDGLKSTDLFFDLKKPMDNTIVGVTFVGIEVPEEVAYVASTVEPEEDPFCDDCGNLPKVTEDGLCAMCAADADEQDEEDWADLNDAIDEAEHISETGLTRAGELPTNARAVQAAGFLNEKTFSKDGITYTASTIKQGVKDYGQRGYARITGIARTTLQEWLKAIK